MKNVSDGSVSGKSAGGKIDGRETKVLATPQSSLTLESDGTSWLIVAQLGTIQ